MTKCIISLGLWFIAIFIVSSLFVPAHPPGGVTVPYYFALLLIPLAVYSCARHCDRIVIAICYGLLCGFFFTFPIFPDLDLDLRYGIYSKGRVYFIFTLVVTLSTLSCIASIYIWRSIHKSKEAEQGAAANP